MNNGLNDFINKTIENTDDYIWITFSKKCGYSFMFPFLKNDSINALYRHLDILWDNNCNLIWLEINNQTVIIRRSDNRTIREFITNNNILRDNYHVFFQTLSYNNILNISCNNHNDHDCKNID
jgi:hypothetical protein